MTGYVGPTEKTTLENKYFRQVLFAGKLTQLVTMCLPPREEIGNEVHLNVDQFFRIEEGKAKFVCGKEEHMVRRGDAVIVPAGTYHNIINASPTKSLKLYTVVVPVSIYHNIINTSPKTKADVKDGQHHTNLHLKVL